MNIQKFIQLYPFLYHMAERGTWPSIRERGLISTTAILDEMRITGQQRIELEERHRPEMVTVGPVASSIVLRDQKPMPPGRLAKALMNETTPEQWYKYLNGKVFMWADKERLLTLLEAYGEFEHDVLTIDTATLVEEYKDRISLCRMNSGNTKPYIHKRGLMILCPLRRILLSLWGNRRGRWPRWSSIIQSQIWLGMLYTCAGCREDNSSKIYLCRREPY